jgi:alpha-1,3-glucosyltransferase
MTTTTTMNHSPTGGIIKNQQHYHLNNRLNNIHNRNQQHSRHQHHFHRLHQRNEQQRSLVSPALLVIVFGFSALLRVLVGFHPHSGQDNYHGSQVNGVAIFGDYEAQRHWMEITFNLPSVGDWYWYDLSYWGLDYPPLTAYVSWICGLASHSIVGPESVALDESRGVEDPTHKAFMRATVLVLDLLVFGTAVWIAAYRNDRKSLWTVFITLVQPAIILIDHGHFQYNTVALGLALAAFMYMSQQGYDVWDRTMTFSSCLWGGFLFCLALNFKQMTLYYAPAVFFYLLGRCMAKGPVKFFTRIVPLGLVVLFTFYVLWEPFVKYPPTHPKSFTNNDDFTTQFSIDNPPTPLQRLEHVVRRIFPFQRGLFEGKVSNLWCALNTKPVKIRDRIPSEQQPILALCLTALLMLPSCWKMIRMGLNEFNGQSRQHQTTTLVQQRLSVRRHHHWHWIQVLWAMTSCSLSFFLASFQVHEKSILLALAPCSLLLWQDPIFVEWFSLVSAWTLWPLLQVDRLQIPYFCCVVIFTSLVWFRRMGMGQMSIPSIFSRSPPGSNVAATLFGFVRGAIPLISYLTMIGLHVAQMVVPNPIPSLPDVYEVLWSVVGCGLFCVAWFVTVVKMYGGLNHSVAGTRVAKRDRIVNAAEKGTTVVSWKIPASKSKAD